MWNPFARVTADGEVGGGDRRPRLTRAQALARGAAAAGAVGLGGAIVGAAPKLAESKPSSSQDARIFQWLLRVEYIQAGFYTEAERRGALKGELREYAGIVGRQERAHVDRLEKQLRGKAKDKPELDFGDATADPDKFLASVVDLEEMALAAFNGQVPNLTKQALLLAMEIASVEARHVGWARDLAGKNPAPRPADKPATQAQTSAAIQQTGFVA